MARAQLGESMAPFAEARARGFLFFFEGWDRLHRRLDQYWDEAPAPLLITGPLGGGKSTAVRSWLRHRQINPLSIAVLEAGWLHQGSVAKDILLAFGHRPTDDADAIGALTDFIEDRAEAGEPPVVLIANMHEGPQGLLEELLALDDRLDLDGQGLHLLMTADLDHWQSADDLHTIGSIEAHALAPLHRGETERVVAAIVAALLANGGPSLQFTEEAVAALHGQSEGLIGLMGSLFDDAVDRAVEEDRSVILAQDLGMADPSVSDAAFSPRIDEVAAFLATRPVPKPSAVPQRRFSFPKIETSEMAFEAPANDRRSPPDHQFYNQLEALRSQTRELESDLQAIRQTVTALQSRGNARQKVLQVQAERLSDAIPQHPEGL